MHGLLYAFDYIGTWISSSEKNMEYFQWSGTISMQISAVLVSVSVVLATTAWAFIGFLIAHIVWAVSAHMMNIRPLFYQSVFFIPLDLWAIGVRL